MTYLLLSIAWIASLLTAYELGQNSVEKRIQFFRQCRANRGQG